MIVLQVAIFAGAGIDRVAAIQDYRNATFPGEGSTEAIRESARRWGGTYDGGTILIDTRLFAGPTQLFINLAGIRNHNYITADNAEVWDRALEDPVRHARWLIDPGGIAAGPSVIELLLRSNAEAAAGYELVYDERGFRVYRLRS